MSSYNRTQNPNPARAEIWRRVEEGEASLEQLLTVPPKKRDGSLTTTGNIHTEYQQCLGWNRTNPKNRIGQSYDPRD